MSSSLNAKSNISAFSAIRSARTDFGIVHLEDLLADAKVVPAVNQVELHPHLTQKELLQYCRSKGIETEAWSPLGQGQLLDHETLKEIAAKYGKTAAQVILRWDLQVGVEFENC